MDDVGALSGRVALVTGSSRGIGRSIALRLARDGARVAIHGRDHDAVQEVLRDLRSGDHTGVGVLGDVSRSADVDRLFADVLGEFGRLDILVNNAAWADAFVPFRQMTDEIWDRVLAANARSVFLCARRASDAMIANGSGGVIVNISSYGAARAQRGAVAYAASKGALEAATRALAIELAPWGIRVNAVAPGAIRTDAWDRLNPNPEDAERIRLTVPLARIGTPDDVAGPVAFLCSDDAAYITGQILSVDGGVLAQLRPSTFEKPEFGGPPPDPREP
jgi:3-oxoacyl-[acyl-carrier protein] reductase